MVHEPDPLIDWQPVVVAAGTSSRFGTRDKLMEMLGDRPVLAWSIGGMLSLPSKYPLVVVAPPGPQGAVERVARELAGDRVVIVPGGARRRDSVQAAMEACRATYAAVHDGARPLLTSALLGRILEAASGTPGAVPATPVTDTLVRVGDDQRIAAYPERASLRALQTPQVVRPADWLKAAALDPADVTDESAMVRRLGLSCVLVEGDVANIKITRPLDIRIAAALMPEQENPCTA